MPKQFTGKAATIVVSVVILFIIASFVLTGLGGSSMGGLSGAGSVADVDGTPITATEYNRAYNFMTQRYTQMLGGKNLTSKQIEMFGIKRNALNQLVDEKLLLNLANDIDLGASKKEVIEEIKKLPYFLRNNQFDLNLYKQLLSQNQLTPAEFEKQITDGLKTKKLGMILNNAIVSNNSVKESIEFDKKKLSITIAKIKKSDLKRFIKVSNSEVSKYVTDEKNTARLKSRYNSKKSEYNQAEQVKARHILIKGANSEKEIKEIAKGLTAKNFIAKANKHTQDNSGKGKGGDLGWFGKGRMVPEFEQAAFTLKPGTISKPVKTSFGHHIIYVEKKRAAKTTAFDKVKKILAREILQENSEDQLKKIVENAKKEVKSAISSSSRIKSVKAKYGFELVQNQELKITQNKAGQLSLNELQMAKLFENNEPQYGKFVFDMIDSFYVISTKKAKIDKKAKKKDFNAEREARKNQLAGLLRQEMMKDMRKNAKVTTKVEL